MFGWPAWPCGGPPFGPGAPTVLVVSGLLIYAGAFIGFSSLTIWTTSLTVSLFLIARFAAEGLIISPNNLMAMRALPEHQVMMAAGLLGLMRSVANTLGPTLASVQWDQNYGRHIQHIAERSPMDSFAFTAVLTQFQNSLVWLGEGAFQVPVKSLALMGRLLHTEASTAAWRAYLLWNGGLALIAILPALLVANRLWSRARAPVAEAEPEAVEPVADAQSNATGSLSRSAAD